MCTYFILYLIKFTCLPLLLCILWCLVCFHLLANHEFCFLNWISYLRETQLKSWTQKISFYQWRCSELLLWVGMKCISRLPSLFWQEVCSEYRQFVRNGKLPCTRENDPVQGPDGKMHGNTCSMCEAFLWVELRPLFLLSAGEARPVVGEREHAEDFLSEADSEGDLFTEFGDLLLQSCLLSAFL